VNELQETANAAIDLPKVTNSSALLLTEGASVVEEPQIEKNKVNASENGEKKPRSPRRHADKKYRKKPENGRKIIENEQKIDSGQDVKPQEHKPLEQRPQVLKPQELRMQEQKFQEQKSQEQRSQEQKPQERTQEHRQHNKNYLRKSSNKRFTPRDNRQNQKSQLNLANKSVTVVVPLFNEEDSLVELSVSLKKILDNLRCSWEVIFIDDGSTDNSYQKLLEIHRVNTRFKCLKFKRNYGKSAALQEGFKAAKGDYVITMDADLQDDPSEIPALISKLNEGFDLVSGWKKVRHDPFIKKHTSKLFNKVTSIMVGLRLHDYNCGLKAYVKDVVKNVKVYGEMHRYIPALAYLSGYKVTEIAVTHHERKYGKTKYGLSRFFNGLFDLVTVLFTTKYIKRPLHLFGFVGVLTSMFGFGILLYLTIIKFVEHTPISGRPLFFVSILMAIVGVQFFSLGLIGEMITKTSVENDNVIIDKTLG
jgi:glycosyltransferase involved in cell wall biosynthesis